MLSVDVIIIAQMREFIEVKRFAEITQLVSTTWAYILSYSKAPALLSELKKKKTFKFIFNGQNKSEISYCPFLIIPNTHSYAIWVLLVETSLSMIIKNCLLK